MVAATAASAAGLGSTAGYNQLEPWFELRRTLPVGALFCILRGRLGGGRAPAGIRSQHHQITQQAGVRRRFSPHQLRYAHAVEMSREGVPLLVIQRQSGTRIGRSPPRTCVEKTTLRLSTPSTNGPRR